MPQMSPFNWVFIMFMFLFILSFILLKIFFSYSPLSTKGPMVNFNKMNNYTLPWLW